MTTDGTATGAAQIWPGWGPALQPYGCGVALTSQICAITVATILQTEQAKPMAWWIPLMKTPKKKVFKI